jgi:Xaa-Pro dipeptidase
MKRRRGALEDVMEERGVDHVILYGANRFGSAVQWLTRWPVTREALVLVTPNETDVLFVRFYNHIPNARRIATEAEIRWPGQTMGSALDELERRGAREGRIGVVGPLDHELYERLTDFAREVVDLSRDYTRLRLVKSHEELEWLRIGASLTDSAMRALQEGARPGMNEFELGDLVERAYVADGGSTHIHYFGATPMDEPDLPVPAQWPSARALTHGDALICELSASFWDYTGQLLRTFAIGVEPTPLYRDLHAAADAAFAAIIERLRPGVTAAELVDAASVIEEAGFTTRDDLVHGFVGGYLPPILGSPSRTLNPIPPFVFAEGMVIVVQPNVVTSDEGAGVQTGELLLVGESGAERLHDYARGFLRID